MLEMRYLKHRNDVVLHLDLRDNKEINDEGLAR